MINYEKKTITINGRTESIREFSVWWATPHGLYDTLEGAMGNLRDSGILPVAIPVAVGDELYEPILRM
jgi:hypothetical protein